MGLLRGSLAAAMTAAALAPAAPVIAQGHFHTLADHARLEEQDSLRLVIGATGGEPFLQLGNVGPASFKVELVLLRLSDAATGAVERIVRTRSIGPYAVDERIALAGHGDGPVWMESWSATPAGEALEPPPDRDATPIFRAPPSYPVYCMWVARPRETVLVRFQVDHEGRVRNPAIAGSTCSCLEHAALKSVSNWIYAPKLENGAPVRQLYIETSVAFELSE